MLGILLALESTHASGCRLSQLSWLGRWRSAALGHWLQPFRFRLSQLFVTAVCHKLCHGCCHTCLSRSLSALSVTLSQLPVTFVCRRLCRSCLSQALSRVLLKIQQHLTTLLRTPNLCCSLPIFSHCVCKPLVTDSALVPLRTSRQMLQELPLEEDRQTTRNLARMHLYALHAHQYTLYIGASTWPSRGPTKEYWEHAPLAARRSQHELASYSRALGKSLGPWVPGRALSGKGWACKPIDGHFPFPFFACEPAPCSREAFLLVIVKQDDALVLHSSCSDWFLGF